MRFWFAPPAPICDHAGVADAEDMATIHASAFRHGWPAEEIEALIVDPTVSVLVARQGMKAFRRTIGFIMVRSAGDEAEIVTVAVAPARRGRGVGRMLMDEMLRRLYFMRVSSVFLEVDEQNVAALSLYRRLGFRQVGKRPNYYAQGGLAAANALVMRADLK